MDRQRCPEGLNGYQCVLEAGHDGSHRTGWEAPTDARPRPKLVVHKGQLIVGLLILVVALVVITMTGGGS